MLQVSSRVLRRTGSDPHRKDAELPVCRYMYVNCPGSPSVSKKVYLWYRIVRSNMVQWIET